MKRPFALGLVPGLVLGLTGCGGPAGSRDPAMRTIDCALGESHPFLGECRVEVAGRVLVVHHPDGGFRRFQRVDDGRGVIVADGAEPAKVRWISGGILEVAVGQDRYRFPATVRPDDAKTP
ncbi:hypothetical protein [Novosphingobium sp.]|uniref:hypothetical protein n=1 Tax=Novosphingobium sp. TaxID=1874826 RepID=UPI0038B6B84E